MIKNKYLLILPLVGALLAGCGGKQPATPPPLAAPASVPTPAPAPAPVAAQPAAPAVSAPPPGLPSVTTPVAAAPVASSKDGTADVAWAGMNETQILKQLNDYTAYYNRTMFSGDEPRPPLKDLSSLVTAKLLKSVPAPPAGKKFVLEPASGKVTLVPQ